MHTEIFLGKEVLKENALGESDRVITYESLPFFCEEKSVRSAEFYQAMQTGMKAEKVVSVNKYEYYDYMQDANRKFAKVLNSITGKIQEFTILREYEKDDDNVELTLQRGVVHGSS